MKNVRFCRIQWHSEKFSKLKKKKIIIIFFFLASKSRICEEFTNLVPESKSRICEDHELWNHEMWGPPVVTRFCWKDDDYLSNLMLHNDTKVRWLMW